MAVSGSAASGALSQRIAPASIPGQPADEANEAAEEDIGGVVAGHGGGEAFLGELAAAGTGDPDHGQGAQAAEEMNGARAAGVEEAGACRRAKLTPSWASQPPPQIQ